MNNKKENILNININLKKISNKNDLNDFFNNIYLDIKSKNYYKQSRGRKSWKKESLDLLEKCFILFGDNLDIAKTFLPDFNLNQIYRKFQYIKLINADNLNNETISNSDYLYTRKCSKFKKKKGYNQKDTDKMIESLESMSFSKNIKSNKNKRNSTLVSNSDFNIDNFVKKK